MGLLNLPEYQFFHKENGYKSACHKESQNCSKDKLKEWLRNGPTYKTY